MRVALAVNRVTDDIHANMASILKMASQAAEDAADLILFPEAALTGLTNCGDPARDLPLGVEIPGPATDILAGSAKAHGIWLAIGLLEREGFCLYDSAILLSPEGDIVLKHRRIQPQWHARDADPSVYRQGTELSKVETPFGSLAFMICGELFDDGLVSRVRELKPDWLLFPFARCFGDFSWDQQRWDREESPDYLARVQLVGVTAFMVNYLADSSLNGGSFGGAMVVTGEGKVIKSMPLGESGMLLVETDSIRGLP